MALYEYLESIGACDESLEWIEENNLTDPREAWEKASAPDLFWVAMRHAGQPGWTTRRWVILTLCDYVEPVLQSIPAGDDRPRKAIDTARAWANGRATAEECRSAANAVARAAGAAAAAVRAVAAAVRAVASVARAAGAAATDAAAAAVRAANAANAADAAASSGLDADFVRSRLTLGEVRYE